MKAYFIYFILILTGVGLLHAQQCSSGQRWNSQLKKCESIDLPDNMQVVNYKCPNGSSWVSFKEKCLDNQRVKEIYDSLRIEYLKSPELVERKTIVVASSDKKEENSGFKLPTINFDFLKNKKDEMESKSNEPIAVPTESILITANDFTSLRDEVLNLKTELIEIKKTNEFLKQEMLNFKTVSNQQSSGEEQVIASLSSEQVNFLKDEIESFKEQIAEMQKVVNQLQNAPKNAYANMEPGKNNTSISKSDIYGKSEVQFKVSCPKGFKWVNEESICLHEDAFINRSHSIATTGTSNIEYGIKDVKCPKHFLWNSKSQNCIPTMHAALK